MEDMRDKREMMKPILVKMGVAVGLTFSGFVISHLRQRRIGPHLPPQPWSPGRKAGIKDEARLLPPSPASSAKEATPPAPQKAMENEAVGLPPTNTKSGDAGDFVLPEFTEFIQKDSESAGFSPTIKDMETAGLKGSDNEVRVMLQEINNLRNAVQVLRERERSLEIQLLEYYGLQEQEAAVREQQNRLKISSMENQLLTIKIESLQSENRRLESRVADQSRIITELDLAKAKVKHMKRKIRSDSEQAKEQLAALHLRVAALKEHELKLAQSEADKAERLKGLEEELAELRKANSKLQDENSELVKKLESAQNAILSIPSSPQAHHVSKEVEQLRNAKEELEKEVDRLRTDRCADVEELVYLRWVNACLRYELRNYKTPPGKTVARDLSSSLSPRSEAKAKQLILEYANSGGATTEQENHQSIIDFDLDYYTPSQSSTADLDDSSLDPSCAGRHSNSSAKGKFFGKLKKIVLGKDGHGHSHKTRSAASERKNSVSIASLDDLARTSTTGSSYSCIAAENAGSNRSSSDLRGFHDSGYTSSGLQCKAEEEQQNKLIIPHQDNHPRLSLEIHRLRKMSLEEMKEVISRDEERRSDGQISSSSSRYKRMDLDDGHQSQHENQHQQDNERSSSSHKQPDLVMKFAQALKSSRSKHKAQHRPTPSAFF